MLEIVKHIKEFGLDYTIEKFRLKSKMYEHKALIKYDQIDSDMSLTEVREARGLVLELNTWKVLNLAFKKFFNSAETHAAKIDWSTAHILEKLDGSCISVYYDWNDLTWYAATTGTANGEGEVNNKLGTTFNQLFWDTVINKYNLNTCLLNEDLIYVFELMTPYNIVVKPHGESTATLLTVRNRVTLEEIPYGDLFMVSESLGVPLVKSYDLNNPNVGKLIKTFEGMSWHEEGYVVVDGKMDRIKIKNPAYLAVHHLKGKTAEHNIITIVKSNEIEEFTSTFPDRKDELYRLKSSYDSLVSKLEEAWSVLYENRPKNITKEEKKRYATSVFDVCNKMGLREFSGLFFSLNDGKVNSVKEYMLNFDDKKLYKIL
jgi:hypothetical protein